ncbi:MAG: hypothetical protein JJU33_14900 [Phycisphaerales bacterium]|nr:hypothetical protein [Phycisphaerales bacterium]
MTEPESKKPERPARELRRRPKRRARRRVVMVEVRRRRWLRRLIWLLILAAIAVGVYLGAEAVRKGDLPRSIAESVASRTLGLRVEIAEVELAWSGETVVRGITVRLPLEEQVMIEVGRVGATHRHVGLIGLLRDPGLRRLELEEVRVIVERDAAGGWNIAEALARVGAALGGRDGGGGGVPGLPELRAESVTIVLRDTGRDVGELRVNLTGDPETSVAYAFEVSEATLGSARGRIGVGADWAHRVSFQLDSLGPLVDFLPEDFRREARAVNASGRWSGQVSGGGLKGRLQLDHADLGPLHASGGALLFAGAGEFGIEPRSIRILADDIGEAQLTGGAVRYANGSVGFEKLRAKSLGVTADIEGAWRLGRETGQFSIVWSGGQAGPIDAHHGSVNLRVLLSEAGRTVLTGSGESVLDAGPNAVRAAIDFDASGNLPDRASAGFSFSRLEIWDADGGVIDLSRLGARVAYEPGLVSLSNLNLPQARLRAARAEYAIDTGAWNIDIGVEDWLVPGLDALDQLSLAAQASGRGAAADEWDLSLQSKLASVQASGSYDPYRQTPLLARTTVALRIADETEDGAAPALIAGSVFAELELGGTLNPVELAGEGSLALADLRLRGEPLEPVTMRGLAEVDADGIVYTSERFELLGGEAGIVALIDPDASIDVRIGADGLAFDQLSEAVGVGARLAGVAGFELVAKIPEGDAGRATLTGEWSGRNLVLDPIEIAQASGRIEADRAEARLQDILLRQGDGHVSGTIAYDLITEAGLRVDLEARRWPVRYAEFDAVLDAELAGSVDIESMTADMLVKGRAEASYQQNPIGSADFDGAVRGQTLEIGDAEIIAGDGRINARGRLPLNDWTETELQARIEGLDAVSIARRFAPPDADELLDDLRGLVDGELSVSPSRGPGSFGPLLVDLRGSVDRGGFREVDLDAYDIRLWAGPERVVLEHARLTVADGSIEAWGTSTMHGSERFVRLNATLGTLDLDRIARTADPTMDPVPGRLSGSVVVGGYMHRPHRLFGESTIIIEDSDLANVGVIATLYDAMNVRIGDRDPTGRGFANVRLEGEALDVTRFEYFNRGVDIFASLRLGQVMALGESPLDGYAGGRVRPLRDLGLPFAATIDRMLTSAQADAVTVRIGGTLEDRSIRVVPFSEAFEGLSGILGRDRQPAEER